MADQARPIAADEYIHPIQGPSYPRVKDVEAGVDGIDRVVRFTLPEKREDEGVQNTSLTARDFAAAVDIVHGAAEAIRAAESRAREAEVRSELLVQRATEELTSAETRVQAAEARAQAAEARTKEAESWLRQIFSTITEELPVHRSGQI